MYDAVLEALKNSDPGRDFAVDRLLITNKHIYVRKEGVWVEVRPFNFMEKWEVGQWQEGQGQS